MGVITIKKVISILIIISIFLCSSSFAANYSSTLTTKDKFIFDGKILSYHFSPLVKNGISFIPLEAISTILSIEAHSDPTKKIISIKTGTVNFSVQLGSTEAFIDSIEYELAAPIISLGNIVYIPLDFAVGATYNAISWNLDENIAYLEPGNSIAQHSDTLPVSTLSINDSAINLTRIEPSNNLILVNKWNPVPSNYIPDNLKSVIDKNRRLIIPAKLNTLKLNSKAMDALVDMLKTSQTAGYKDIIVSSAYRTYSDQTFFYNNKVNLYSKTSNIKDAQIKAATIVAPPGMSEHQTGLAIDITTKLMLKTTDPLSSAFGNTPQGKWINDNSYKYGYIVRYKPDKSKFTGIISEPWHLRYVGLPHSEIMKKNNLSLEEYLEYIKKTKYIKYTSWNHKNYEIFYFNLFPSEENFIVSSTEKSLMDFSKYGKFGYIITKEMS